MKHLLAPFTRLSVLLLATGFVLLAQTSASYNRQDTGTQGIWTGHYGVDGYQIANGSSMDTGYGGASILASAYTWTSNAGASPALQSFANASTYIASAYLAGTALTVNVTLTDGKSHNVALYLLDWDGGGQRAETITVQNAATGATLPNVPVQSMTGFQNGVWLSYTVTGNVNFVIQSTNTYLNAVVSGIFFDPSASAQQPQSITFNSIPAQTVGTPLTLTATATSGLAVSYTASPGNVCTVSGTTATFLTGGSTCTITASQAGNSNWAAATSVPLTFAVSSGGSPGQTTASYLKSDAVTGGVWTGHYGGDGYQIANGNTMNTGYGGASISASAYTWTSNAGGSPALQSSANASTYIASAYLAGTALTVNVNLMDGKSHNVALYLLDWDGGGQRAETITVQNAATGASLSNAPVQSLTGFQNGVWVVYTVTGNVNFVIQSTNTYLNAVVSGVFFDPAAPTAPTQQPQSITFNTITGQTVGTPLTLTATATSGLAVSYSASPGNVCTVSGTTATFLTGGSTCAITASQAGNSSWAAATPVPQTFNVSNSGPQTTANYIKSDVATSGVWGRQYGSDGYQIANGSTVNTGYGGASISASAYTWSSNAGGSPALQNSANANTYIASAYLAATAFTINVNLTDGKSHNVALYLLDWDGGGQRAETITVQDAATGASLPNAPVQTMTGFQNGVWLSYTVTGNVNFVIQSTNPYLNAVVSGIFFGAGAASTNPAQQPQSITFSTIPTQTAGTPLTLTATATSALSVSYTASPGSVCTVSGSTATFLTGGSSCTITASQAGNSNWATATPVAQTFTVNSSSSGVTAGIYDDRDPLVTYKGSWGNNLDPNRYNDTQSFSNNAGDSASFTFTGNQISYVFARQWNLGNLQISIDGAPQTPPANLYSATEVGEQVITYSNLSYATHTITVTVAGMPVSGSSNSYVVIDAFIVGPVGAFAGAYDDQDPAIVYSSSGWGMNSAAMRYDGTQHFSQQAGSTASFTFTGTQVNYVYELQNNAGQAQVSIDGTVVAAQLDEYAAAATGPTVASYSGLSNATHTITITALGTSNPRSSSAYVIVDAFFTGPVATISGNISAPVSGTTVTLSGGSSGGSSLTGNTLESVTVGSNGTYSLPVAAGPNYTVTPSLANATFSPISLSFSEVRTNLPGENFTATMNAPAPPTSYQISGQVVFGNGPSVNTGVPNVTLTLSNGQSATSLSDGSYSFTVNAAGAYTITASYPGSPGFYALSAPKAVTVASTSAAYPNNNFTVTFVSGGSLSPSSPSKEYIFLNGSIIAVEHPH